MRNQASAQRKRNVFAVLFVTALACSATLLVAACASDGTVAAPNA
jgi:hypothetical protein